MCDHNVKQWNENMIVPLLGYDAFEKIQEEVQHPVPEPVLQDRLVWIASKEGVYTVKEGYTSLALTRQVRPVYGENQAKARKAIWKWKDLIPRVRLFYGGPCITD